MTVKAKTKTKKLVMFLYTERAVLVSVIVVFLVDHCLALNNNNACCMIKKKQNFQQFFCGSWQQQRNANESGMKAHSLFAIFFKVSEPKMQRQFACF